MCLSESTNLPVHVLSAGKSDWVAEGAPNSKGNPEERLSAALHLRGVSRRNRTARLPHLSAVVSSALRVGTAGMAPCSKSQVTGRNESDFVCMDCRDSGFEDSPPMTRRRVKANRVEGRGETPAKPGSAAAGAKAKRSGGEWTGGARRRGGKECICVMCLFNVCSTFVCVVCVVCLFV